jgi:hypothetical protein
MKVSVSSESGLLWSNELAGDQRSCFTSTGYLQDGTQEKIISALQDALAQARGQSGRFDEADIISKGGPSSGIDCYVPVS